MKVSIDEISNDDYESRHDMNLFSYEMFSKLMECKLSKCTRRSINDDEENARRLKEGLLPLIDALKTLIDKKNTEGKKLTKKAL